MKRDFFIIFITKKFGINQEVCSSVYMYASISMRVPINMTDGIKLLKNNLWLK